MIHVDELPVQVKKYTDGSLEVTNSGEIHKSILDSSDKFINVTANIKSSDDLLALVLVKGIIDRSNSSFKYPCVLKLPYVPYMRSDRAMNEHSDVGGLKIVSPVINNLNFDSVVVFDPHSDVTESLIKNIRIVSQHEGIGHFQAQHKGVFDKYDFVVSPDAGALKKVAKCAKTLSKPHIEAFKEREINTNKILRTSVNANKEDLEGKSVLIIDDILEYGTTVRELAKTLKEDYGVANIGVYVTHAVLPLNLRESPASHTSFILDYLDNIYGYFWWPECSEKEVPEQALYLNLFH
jgi:ribose-phosphate pyrophosphokinase